MKRPFGDSLDDRRLSQASHTADRVDPACEVGQDPVADRLQDVFASARFACADSHFAILRVVTGGRNWFEGCYEESVCDITGKYVYYLAGECCRFFADVVNFESVV